MPTLKLIATNVDYKAIPDPGTELGDRQIFTDDLRKQESDPPIGTHSAVCVLVRKPNLWLCHAGWSLPDVDLMAGLLWTSPDLKFTAAILGGTRDYRKARGQIEGATRPQNPAVTDYTLKILTFP